MKTNVPSTCPICYHTDYIEVVVEDYDRWTNGELIQKAMPYLSPDQREQLMTGICPCCWTKSFGEE